jgi:hypothetical protein
VPETVEALIASARLKEAAYLLLLKKIEARLGTPAEQPNDLSAVRQLAHSLLSIACVTSFVPSRPHAKK